MVWVLVFLPAIVRARQETPLSSSERFKRRMELIAPRSTGRWIVVPDSPQRLVRASLRRRRRRRTRALVALLAAALVSLGAAVSGGGELWLLHLACDASLAAYVVYLRADRRRRETSGRPASSTAV